MKKILSCFIIFLSLICRDAYAVPINSVAKPHLTSRASLLSNPANPSPMRSERRLSFDYVRSNVVDFPEYIYDEYTSDDDMKILTGDFMFENLVISAGFQLSQSDSHVEYTENVLNAESWDDETRISVPVIQVAFLASESLTLSLRLAHLSMKMDGETETSSGVTSESESASYLNSGLGLNYSTETNLALGLYFSPEAGDGVIGQGRYLQIGVGYVWKDVFSCGLDFFQVAENEKLKSSEVKGFLLSGEAKIGESIVLEAGYEDYDDDDYNHKEFSANLVIPVDSFFLSLGLSQTIAESKDYDYKYEFRHYNMGVLWEF